MRQHIVWLVPVIRENIYGKPYLEARSNLFPDPLAANQRILDLFSQEPGMLGELSDVQSVIPVAIQYPDWDNTTVVVSQVATTLQHIVDLLEWPRPDHVDTDPSDELPSGAWLTWEIPTAIPEDSNREEQIEIIREYLLEVTQTWNSRPEISSDSLQVHLEFKDLPQPIHVGISPMDPAFFDPEIQRELMDDIIRRALDLEEED